jgi:hypothetical protein
MFGKPKYQGDTLGFDKIIVDMHYDLIEILNCNFFFVGHGDIIKIIIVLKCMYGLAFNTKECKKQHAIICDFSFFISNRYINYFFVFVFEMQVDIRYKQYHHQMQGVISSFEQAAGYGAAKSYTSLALKTISKQFRSLKDAISSQIKSTSKTLGEDDCLGVKLLEGSRLRFVDHHLRQQRALQQLGMIQSNAWRPQRGLPERAVSVLRAWLFEHFLHP